MIRALELDPDYATAHNWYGDLLTIQGQLEAGAEEKRKGQASDPLSLILNTDIGRDFMFLHQWDRAIAQLQKTLEMDPNFVVAQRWLARMIALLTGWRRPSMNTGWVLLI